MGTTPDMAPSLWERRGFRRLVLCVALVLQLALVGLALGWTLTPNGHVLKSHPHATASHSRMGEFDRDFSHGVVQGL